MRGVRHHGGGEIVRAGITLNLVQRLLAAFARNAIPLYGVAALGWAPGTLVLLFVIDVVLSIAVTSLRIRAHEAATRNPKHRQPAAYRKLPGITMETPRGVFWRDYFEFAFTRAVMLSIMAYAFPLIITLKFPSQRPLLLPEWTALAMGAAGMVVVHWLDWLGERGRLASVPFATVYAAARGGYGQVLLLAALVMGGCFASLHFKDVRAIGYVLVALKLIADLFEAMRKGMPGQPSDS